MKSILSLTCLVFSLSACTLASCGEMFPLESRGWSDAENGEVPDQLLSLSTVEIGVTTLDEVVSVFGDAVAYRAGVESYQPKLICYLSDTDDVAVVFQSGPLGGWSELTAIWVGHSKFVDSANCAVSSDFDSTRTKLGAVSLHAKPSTIEAAFGAPTFSDSTFVAYRYQKRKEFDDAEGLWDITSGLEVGLEAEAITWFRIYRRVSN